MKRLTTAKQLEMQLKSKAALFLSVIDRANKATRRKKDTAAGANKQFTVQLFEGLLTDTFGNHKKDRESQLVWMSRTLYHLIRENVDLEHLRRLLETGLELRLLRMYRG